MGPVVQEESCIIGLDLSRWDDTLSRNIRNKLRRVTAQKSEDPEYQLLNKYSAPVL
jgi:hypothetical protein